MKALILAGGYGSRLGEETILRPKPMIEIGNKPILWHIMKIYSGYGVNEFIILLGYQGYVIKEYFLNYFAHQNDLMIDLKQNKLEFFNNGAEPWKIMLLDTGIDTKTGSRIKKAQHYLGDETFLLTYGDGVADINIRELIEFHNQHKKIVTVTAVKPDGRFGALEINDNNKILKFLEKPKGDGSWINGGFFVCNSKVFDYIEDGNDIPFEQEVLPRLAQDGQLFSYKHEGFWKCMDTTRDKMELCGLWSTGEAKWKTWRDKAAPYNLQEINVAKWKTW